MSLRIVSVSFVFLLAVFSFSQRHEKLPSDYSVAKLLESLGDDPSPHKPNTDIPRVSVERGRDIVVGGRSRHNGVKSRRQSRYFTCLACHNNRREDPNLANPSSVLRLKFVSENQMPYLPGSPLYGIINRKTFYNGDYVKKYGDLVEPTRNNLREAIQLCAIECSQGRKLKPFELESVLAYLWTIDLKLNDLDLSSDELDQIQQAFDTGSKRKQAIDLINSKFLDHSPATFMDPPADRKEANKRQGDPQTGALLYKWSCQHCHFDNQYSFLLLDNTKQTFRHLLDQSGKYTSHSLYQVVRYGTQPKGGKRAYMPLYTKEKMTDQQMADLKAFFEVNAARKEPNPAE